MAHRMVNDDLVELLTSKERTHGWLRDRGLFKQFGGLCESLLGCGISLTSGQLFNELFPGCTVSE